MEWLNSHSRHTTQGGTDFNGRCGNEGILISLGTGRGKNTGLGFSQDMHIKNLSFCPLYDFLFFFLIFRKQN